MGNKYVVESTFEDLHGNPAEESDLELDVSDSENPIIQAALDGSDDEWTPPDDDDGEKPKKKTDDDEDDDDDLEDIEDEDSDEEDEDSEKDDDEDADEDADEEDDEDEEEDDKKYSKNVQKRIDRERELRRQEKAESDAKMRRMERKLELRDEKDKLRDEERKTESKLRKLRKQKADALDDNDNSKIVEIDEEMLELKSDLKVRQSEVKKLEENIDIDDGPDTGGVPEAGRKWLAKYPEFNTNDAFKDVVLTADKMVARRGLDKNTDKYYAEIEKIVAVQFPEIVKQRAAKVRKKPRRKKPAVGGTQKPGTRKRKTRKGRKGVIRLTKTDQEQMRNFGLDPKNPTHAKEWAANKTDD